MPGNLFKNQFPYLTLLKLHRQLKIWISPAKLDIGKLTYEYHIEEADYNNPKAFISNKLKNAREYKRVTPKDVVLYGFGRIGRLLARELMTRTGKGSQLRLRGIVTRGKVDAVVLEKELHF